MIEKWAKAIQNHEGWIKPGGAYPRGSRSYRNNNPGNLRYTTYTASLGKNSGHDDKNFIIYENYEVGFAALKQFLIDAATNVLRAYKEYMPLYNPNYVPGNGSVPGFYQVYAPSADSNNPLNYATAVAAELGVPVSVQIKALLDPVEAPAPTPSVPAETPKGEVVSQKQGDPAWGAIKIGQSNTTVAKDGCLITCISDYLFWLGFKMNPGQLAKLFRYTPKGSLYWESLANAPLKFVYRYWHFDKKVVDSALRHPTQGVMIEVPFAGASHWLWVVGKDWFGRYKVADPLRGDFTAHTRYATPKGMAIIDKK